MALSTPATIASSLRMVSPLHVAHRSTVLHHAHAPAPVLDGGKDATGVRLTVAWPAKSDVFDTLTVMPTESIRDIKLRLNNRGWFSSSRHCLVFGDQALADDIKVSELVQSSGKQNSAYLHVFVRLADVESVELRTAMCEVKLGVQPEGTDTVACGEAASALTTLAPLKPAALGLLSEAALSRAVVHLCVHKSAKVNWRHMSEDKFELSISSSETVDSLMRKIEAANCMGGIDSGSHQVLHNGRVLPPGGKPLAAYGVSKGSVLELVPVEPATALASVPVARALAPPAMAAEAALLSDAAAAASDDEPSSPTGSEAAAAGDAAAVDVSGLPLPDGSPRLSSPAHRLHQHWQRAREGLAGGRSPRLAPAGTGGSYFLCDVHGNSVAVFKPEDEEPCAVNNPKGHTSGVASAGEGMRRGTRPGEGAVREVAAYVLDHGNFAGVPPTALVSAVVNPGGAADAAADVCKVGSLQQYVDAEGDCEERGCSAFPVHEVHKIATLDIRLANTDRNGGNILARRGSDSSWQLVPIDHGYVLPSSFEDISFEWLYWPQAEQPFDAATRAYIAGLDAERDVATLAAHGLALRPECLRVLRVCTMLLQKAAAAGLTAYQIGSIMCREAMTKSPLEKLHANALCLAAADVGGAGLAVEELECQPAHEAAYLARMGPLIDEYLEEFLLEGEMF